MTSRVKTTRDKKEITIDQACDIRQDGFRRKDVAASRDECSFVYVGLTGSKNLHSNFKANQLERKLIVNVNTRDERKTPHPNAKGDFIAYFVDDHLRVAGRREDVERALGRIGIKTLIEERILNDRKYKERSGKAYEMFLSLVKQSKERCIATAWSLEDIVTVSSYVRYGTWVIDEDATRRMHRLTKTPTDLIEYIEKKSKHDAFLLDKAVVTTESNDKVVVTNLKTTKLSNTDDNVKKSVFIVDFASGYLAVPLPGETHEKAWVNFRKNWRALQASSNYREQFTMDALDVITEERKNLASGGKSRKKKQPATARAQKPLSGRRPTNRPRSSSSAGSGSSGEEELSFEEEITSPPVKKPASNRSSKTGLNVGEATKEGTSGELDFSASTLGSPSPSLGAVRSGSKRGGVSSRV